MTYLLRIAPRYPKERGDPVFENANGLFEPALLDALVAALPESRFVDTICANECISAIHNHLARPGTESVPKSYEGTCTKSVSGEYLLHRSTRGLGFTEDLPLLCERADSGSGLELGLAFNPMGPCYPPEKENSDAQATH